jgi:hypothetical protein
MEIFHKKHPGHLYRQTVGNRNDANDSAKTSHILNGLVETRSRDGGKIISRAYLRPMCVGRTSRHRGYHSIVRCPIVRFLKKNVFRIKQFILNN